MSHGPAGDGNAEPNLVPLLDLVLQLVMFFMMCTTLAMEEVDANIKLPLAQSAKPTEQTDSDIIFLNVNDQGDLLVQGKNAPLTTEDEIVVYLRGIYETSLKQAQEKALKAGDAGKPQANVIVVIRAHRDSKFAKVYRIMRKCQEVGLRKLQLRANMQTGGN